MNQIKKTSFLRLNALALRTCGCIFLLLGILGSQIQQEILGVGNVANSQLFQLMQTDSSAMQMATLALVFQMLETCAVPIFVFLLVEGCLHTSHFGKYFLRVLLLAVACQPLYAMSVGGLNPVFALVMSMIMLYFFRRYPGKQAAHRLLKIVAIIGTFLWSNILGIPNGAPCILIAAVLWGMREKPYFRPFASFAVTLACSIFSPFYIAAALSFLILYFYNGERGPENKLVNYLSYPAILLVSHLLRFVI